MAKAWQLSAPRAGAHACVRRARETTIELLHLPPGEDTCNIQVGHCEGLPREVSLPRQRIVQNAQRLTEQVLGALRMRRIASEFRKQGPMQ